MAPPELVAVAFPMMDASLSQVGAMGGLAPCEHLDRTRCGRARSHGRRLGEARPDVCRGPSSRTAAKGRPDCGVPPLRSRTAMNRGGCSVPAPCQKSGEAVQGPPRPSMRRVGNTRRPGANTAKPAPVAEVIEIAPVAVKPLDKSITEPVEKKELPAEEASEANVLKDALSSVMDEILRSKIEDHDCEDVCDVGYSPEAWEIGLRDTLMERAIAQVAEHNCEDDLDVSAHDATILDIGLRGTLLDGALQQTDELYCEDDRDVPSLETQDNEFGTLLLRVLDDAVSGAEQLSREDKVQVYDEDDAVVDIELLKDEEESANAEDVDGILVKIFRKAMTSLRAELCDEFGMELGMDVFSDLEHADDDDYSCDEVFSIASEEVPEIDDVEDPCAAEPDGARALERELGVEAATLAEEALRSAMGLLAKQQTLELAQDEFPEESSHSPVDVKMAFEHELQMQEAIVRDGLAMALKCEAVDLANQMCSPGGIVKKYSVDDDAVSLASDTLFACEPDSQTCPTTRRCVDDMLMEESAELAFEESLEREAIAGFGCVDMEVLSDDEALEEFEQDIEILQMRLERALHIEASVLAEEEAASSQPSPMMVFLRDMEELRARARDALLGFEAADIVEEELDDCTAWNRCMLRLPGLAGPQEPEDESDAGNEVLARMDWCANAESTLEADLQREAEELAAEVTLEIPAVMPVSGPICQMEIFDTQSLASAGELFGDDLVEELQGEMDLAMKQDIELQLCIAKQSLEQVLGVSAGESAPSCAPVALRLEELKLAEAEAPHLHAELEVPHIESRVSFSFDFEALENAVHMESAALLAAEALERPVSQVHVKDHLEDVSGADMPSDDILFDVMNVAEAVEPSSASQLQPVLSREAADLSQELSAALTMTCLNATAIKLRSRQAASDVAAPAPDLVSSGSQQVHAPPASSRKAASVVAAPSPTQALVAPNCSPDSPQKNGPGGRKPSRVSLQQDPQEKEESPQNSPQCAMVRTPSAAGRLRPHLRESIISFRLDDDSDEECQPHHQREPSITGLYETLGADVHCLDDPRVSSRAASPASIPQCPTRDRRLSRAASPANISHNLAPFKLIPQPSAPFVLSPPTTRSRLGPILGAADEALKKSEKVRSSSVGALKDFQGMVSSSFKGSRPKKDGLRGDGLRRSPCVAGY